MGARPRLVSAAKVMFRVLFENERKLGRNCFQFVTGQKNKNSSVMRGFSIQNFDDLIKVGRNKVSDVQKCVYLLIYPIAPVLNFQPKLLWLIY